MTSADVLVTILSITLAVFLILAIVLTAYLIVIAQKIKTIAENTEAASGKFVEIVDNVKSAVAPAVISRIVGDLVSGFGGRFRKCKKED